jgi:uncharacterized RDD family membrane protein YckC
MEQQVDQGTSASVASVPTATPVPVAGAYRVAGLQVSSAGRRFGAYLLDYLLIVVTIGIGWLIWSMFTWKNGQSPAKSLMKMRAVKVEGETTATWGTMFMREFIGKGLLNAITFGIVALISIFGILGASRRAVWDKVAGTIIVDDPEGRLAA